MAANMSAGDRLHEECIITIPIIHPITSRGGRVVSRGGGKRLGGCEFVSESYQDFKLGLVAGP
jgi:hypothetical protein